MALETIKRSVSEANVRVQDDRKKVLGAHSASHAAKAAIEPVWDHPEKTPEIDLMLRQAENYISVKDYCKAFQSYQTISAEYPDDYRGWWGLWQIGALSLSTPIGIEAAITEIEQFAFNAFKASKENREELEKSFEETEKDLCRKFLKGSLNIDGECSSSPVMEKWHDAFHRGAARNTPIAKLYERANANREKWSEANLKYGRKCIEDILQIETPGYHYAADWIMGNYYSVCREGVYSIKKLKFCIQDIGAVLTPEAVKKAQEKFRKARLCCNCAGALSLSGKCKKCGRPVYP
ncbi:MAG: hypothetical protein BWY11_01465 [Firmicutes bacterium ADurb.Bin182]|nr:MAG: hypothetical protein BWY11_01465 [Firmicutes bacterium ADurb.Bin182]